MTYKILLLSGVVFNVLAQFSLKYVMKGRDIFEKDSNVLLNILKFIFNPFFILSILLYGCGFLIYSVALSKLELSKAYPVASAAAIILIFIVSIIFYSESLTFAKILGLFLCIAGIFLIFK